MTEGHEVTGVGRRAGLKPAMRGIRLDMRDAERAEDWLPHLKDIDAVIIKVVMPRGIVTHTQHLYLRLEIESAV